MLGGSGQPVGAQDIHFTQLEFAPQSVSPALQGAFVGDKRFGAILRDQWRSVPVPYTTISVYHDQKLPIGKSAHYLGWGGEFTHDVAGDGQLTWSQLGLAAAFQYQLADEQFVGIGISARVGQRALSPQRLNWGDQYDGELFDPNLPTEDILQQTTAGYVDLAAGIGYRYFSTDRRTQLHGGVAVDHINRPVLTFLQGIEVPFYLHYRVYAFGRIPLTDQYSGTFRLLFRRQGPYTEYAASIGGGIDLLLVNKTPLYLGLTGSYRWQDAVGIGLEAGYTQWRLGFNYDITTSSFSAANRGRGGPEIALQYFIFRPQPPEEFKACPIF